VRRRDLSKWGEGSGSSEPGLPGAKPEDRCQPTP